MSSDIRSNVSNLIDMDGVKLKTHRKYPGQWNTVGVEDRESINTTETFLARADEKNAH